MAFRHNTHTVKWGIMATGGIAETFCKDLLTDPATRSVFDVCHRIVAVASSTSCNRAAEFLRKIDSPSSVKTYGSYTELVDDPDIDIIYVATPHSHHFQNVMLAMEAGKNVLCEKALTVTASQTKKLVKKAKEKNLFFMEAVWTRYFPLSNKIRKLIRSGEIGTIYRTMADLSFNENTSTDDGILKFSDTHRMVNMDLAGGALLDLGIYSLTWVFQTLYHIQPDVDKEPPQVVAAINKYRSGADENTCIICQFPNRKSIGVATTSLLVGTSPHGDTTTAPAIRIQGSNGEIQVPHPAFRPLSFSIIKKEGDGKAEFVECPIPTDPKRGGWGHGMFWEADECARCLRDGEKESSTMPWEESIVIMETMEEALRQGEITYPELITTDIFDVNSPLNVGNKQSESGHA